MGGGRDVPDSSQDSNTVAGIKSFCTWRIPVTPALNTAVMEHSTEKVTFHKKEKSYCGSSF